MFLILLELLIAFWISYSGKGDLFLVLNSLQKGLSGFAIFLYSLIAFTILVYFWLVPYFFKSTIGKGIFSLFLNGSTEKITLMGVFYKTIIGFFWDLVLLPYTLLIRMKKKDSISTRLSGLTYSHNIRLNKIPLLTLFGILTVNAIFLSSLAIYTIKNNPKNVLSRFINYRIHIEEALKVNDFDSVLALLPDYKKRNAEDADYWYWYCISSNIAENTKDIQQICREAKNQNSSNVNRLQELALRESELLFESGEEEKANAILKDLWENQKYRGYPILKYVETILLDDPKKGEMFLNELVAATESKLLEDSPLLLEAYANAYFNIGNYNKEKELYQKVIARLKELNTDKSKQAEILYKLARSHYFLKDYSRARELFNEVKELNPDYSDPAEVYILDMDIKKK